MLLRQLRTRFRRVPAAVTRTVKQADDALPDAWAVRVLRAATIDEVLGDELGAQGSAVRVRVEFVDDDLVLGHRCDVIGAQDKLRRWSVIGGELSARCCAGGSRRLGPRRPRGRLRLRSRQLDPTAKRRWCVQYDSLLLRSLMMMRLPADPPGPMQSTTLNQVAWIGVRAGDSAFLLTSLAWRPKCSVMSNVERVPALPWLFSSGRKVRTSSTCRSLDKDMT